MNQKETDRYSMFDEDHAECVCLSLCRKLQFQPLPAEVPVLFRVVELPQKNHLCKVKSLNKGDANSEVTVYYQVNHDLHTHVHL